MDTGLQNINVIFLRVTQYSCVLLLYITEARQGIGYKKGKGRMSGRFGLGKSSNWLKNFYSESRHIFITETLALIDTLFYLCKGIRPGYKGRTRERFESSILCNGCLYYAWN